jgi:hypothetical protein
MGFLCCYYADYLWRTVPRLSPVGTPVIKLNFRCNLELHLFIQLELWMHLILLFETDYELQTKREVKGKVISVEDS